MATGTVPPELPAGAAPSRAPGEAARYDGFIHAQIQKTRRQVKGVEVVSRLLVLAAGLVTYILAVAVIDSWLVPGGLSLFGRLLAFVLLVVGAGGYVALAIVPLLTRRINPIYAAQAIEQGQPSLKNSLINFLLLRSQRSQIAVPVYDAIERRAANDLAVAPVDSAVDRSPVIRAGYMLLALVTLFCLYSLFSPKSPLQSFRRMLAPWSNVSAPTRVTIGDVQPGATRAFVGDSLNVSALIRGVRSDEPVTLYFTTRDGQSVDQPVAMEMPSDSYRYQAVLPPTGGLQQTLEYRIVAGDAAAGPYHVEVLASPAILIEQVRYAFPPYTGLAPRVVERQGDLKGIEGTQVEITAKTNVDMQSAYIDLNCDGTRDIELSVDGRTAKGAFELRLGPDGKSQYSTYQLRFTDANKQLNPQPIRYEIEVLPDLAPELAITEPGTDNVELPINGALAIAVRAADRDFGLRRVTLHFERAGKSLQSVELLNAPHSGPFVGAHVFEPSRLVATPVAVGDTLQYWAEARDNRAPTPHHAQTVKYRLKIVEAVDDTAREEQLAAAAEKAQQADEANQPPPPDELAGDDPATDGVGAADADDRHDPQREEIGRRADAGDDADSDPAAAADEALRPDPQGDPAEAMRRIVEHQQQQQEQRQQQESGQDGGDDGQQGEAQSGEGQSSEGQSSEGQAADDKSGAAQAGDDRGGDQQSTAGQPGKEQQPDGQAGQQGQPGNDGQPGGEAQADQQAAGQPGTDSEPGKEGAAGKEGQPGQENQAGSPTGDKQGAAQSQGAAQNQQGKQPGDQQRQTGKQPGDKSGEAASPQPGDRPADAGERQPGAQQQQQPSPDGQSGEPKAGDSAPKGGEKAPADQAQPGEPKQGDPSNQPGEGDRAAASGTPDSEKPSSGGKEPADKSPMGGEPESATGDSGAGKGDATQSPSPSPQEANQPRGEKQQSPSGDEKSSEEAGSPSTSPKQSDSQGDEQGDRSGGGGKGGGQKADQPGTGGPGKNTSSDEGGGRSSEPGQGETAPGAGDKESYDKTGQAGGKSAGSGSSAGQGQQDPYEKDQKPPGGAGGRGSAGNSQKQPYDKEQQPQAAGDKQQNAGDKPSGADRQQQQSGGETGGPSSSPGAGGSGRSQGDRFETDNEMNANDASGGQAGGQSGDESGQQQQPFEPTPNQPDAIDKEHAQKATDLVLESLREQMAKDRVDRELLEKLRWSREDMQKFIERWEQLKRDAAQQGPAGDEARKQLDEALEKLGAQRRGLTIQSRDNRVDNVQKLRESRVSKPPAEYREQFEAYTEGAAKRGGK